MKKYTKNMTEGPVLKLVLTFALPMIIGAAFQQFYNLTDALIVGNFVGSHALAAVGATASSVFFLLSFAMGLTNSFSIVMSQYFGAEKPHMVKKTFVNAIYITLGISLLLSIAGIFGARPLMKLLSTPTEIIDDSVIYLQIYIGCALVQVAYNGAAAILRAVGNSKVPLYTLVLAAILNIILDLLFVIKFDMGVPGVAIATVISQGIAMAGCIVFMFRHFSIFRITREDIKPDKENLFSILRIGLPQSLQAIFISVGELVVTGVVNSFGTNVIAAFTTCARIQQFTTMIYLTYAQAFSVFAGQNFGAKKIERIKEGFKKSAELLIVFSILSAVIVFFFGEYMVQWFISDTDVHLSTIVEISKINLRIQACFFPFLAMIWLYNNTLRGVGEIAVPVISGIAELFSKVGLSLLLGYYFGYVGVWFAHPVGWALGMIPSMIRYHSGKWKRLMNRIVKVKE